MKIYKCALTILFLFVTSEYRLIGAENVRQPRKIIIDTDAGGDDTTAILLTLNYETAHKDTIKIIAITCTYGNTKEKNVETNVRKILTIAERKDIPIYGGAEKPLTNNFEPGLHYGKDGLGDFEFDEEITVEVDKSKHAVIALIDLVKSFPGEVSIIALGPLTNLAMATRLDPTFMKNVHEIIIMGSTVTGIGNISPNLEYNFSADPESNFIVLNSTIKPCILVPWEIGTNFLITKEWRNNVFGKLNSKQVNFINKVEKNYLTIMGNNWYIIDAKTVSIILWPNMIKKFIISNVTPVYDGAAAGSVLVDYQNRTGKPQNSKIVQSIDLEFFKKQLLKYFSNLKIFKNVY